MEKQIIVQLHKDFEQSVYTDQGTGMEFWLARDFQNLLGYAKWENFARIKVTVIPPLQGLLVWVALIPRALPWADIFCPFRAYSLLRPFGSKRRSQRTE